MKRFLLAAVAAFLVTPAAFADVPGSLHVTWTLPTTGCTTGTTPCDNVPLTGGDALTGVDVYVSTSPIPDNFSGAPTVPLSPTAQTTDVTLTVVNGSTLYVRLKARNAHGASAFSAQVSKLVQLPVLPNAPTTVVITLVITP